MIRTATLAITLLALAACTASPTRTTFGVYDPASGPARLGPDDPTAFAEQSAALQLYREMNVIQDKPAYDLTLDDRGRLQEIDGELEAMRDKALGEGRSSDHLSLTELDAAMAREEAEGE